MKNILVTGVAGFIGSKVAARLCALNYNVFGINNLSNGYLENIPKNIEFIEGDSAKLIKEIKLDPIEIKEGLKKFCKSVL